MLVDLRPSKLDDIIGNDKIKNCLKISIAAALEEKRPVPHIIFEGGTGLGKTTFSKAIGNAQKGHFYEINAASVTSHLDLLNYFSRIEAGDVLFIDEIHRLKKKFEEFCYPIMEDFSYSINLGDSPLLPSLNLSFEESKTISKFLNVKVPPFTLIGATTDIGNLSGPLLGRFKARYQVHPYSIEDIQKIILRSSLLLKLDLDKDAIEELAKRCKNIPRIANSRLEWVRDYALSIREKRLTPQEIKVGKNIKLNKNDIITAMSMIDIDENGYDQNDRIYLEAVSSMQPIGIQSVAARTGFTPETIQKYIEPFLLRTGKIKITSSGRVTEDFAEDWGDALKSFSLQ